MMAISMSRSNRSLASPSASEWIRTFMIAETATFLLAAAFHFGVFVQGVAVHYWAALLTESP